MTPNGARFVRRRNSHPENGLRFVNHCVMLGSPDYAGTMETIMQTENTAQPVELNDAEIDAVAGGAIDGGTAGVKG